LKIHLILQLFIVFIYSISTNAGNGVERGRIVLNRDIFLEKEIHNYLDKKISNCLINNTSDYFVVNKISILEDEVDQGIVDLYYTIELQHKDKSGNIVNNVEVEVEDADYSNWRKYEEKLSLKLIRDKNKLCR